MAPSPPAVRKLAALLCSTAERRRERSDELRALARAVAPEDLLTFLIPQRLAQLGIRRLTDLDEVPVDPEIGQALGTLAGQTRVWALLQEEASDRVVTALAGAGVSAIPIKGPLLATALYGDPAMRASSDVDVLVEPDRLDQAVAAVTSRTRYRLFDGAPARGRPRLHRVLVDEREVMPPLELHWRIHWYEERFSRDLIDSAAGGPRPDAVHELAALLLFYARDGFLGLRLACDLSTWWDVRGAELGAEGLRPLIERHPALRRSLEASARMADRIVGLPAGRLLDVRRPPERRLNLAIGLGNWPMAGPPEEQSTSVVVIDGLLTPPGGLTAFAARALDPRRSLEGQIRETRSGRAVAMATHPFKVVGRALKLLLWWRGQSGAAASIPRS